MFSIMRGTRRSFIRTVAFLAIAACGGGGDGPTGPGGGNVVGTWTLEFADEDELPYAVYHDSYLDPATGIFFNQYVMEVRNGYIELRENETFYMALQMKVTADGVVNQGVVEFEGEWDEFKDQIILRVQVPIVGQQVLYREGSWLSTSVDFMGFGEETLLEFKR